MSRTELQDDFETWVKRYYDVAMHNWPETFEKKTGSKYEYENELTEARWDAWQASYDTYHNDRR